jgi:predicted GIY-YIG superfamily endonuclease
MIKCLRECKARRNIPQHNKGYIGRTHSQHHPEERKTQNNTTKIKNDTRDHPLSTLLFNTVPQAPAEAVRQPKEIKEMHLGKEIKLSLLADEILSYIKDTKKFPQKNQPTQSTVSAN